MVKHQSDLIGFLKILNESLFLLHIFYQLKTGLMDISLICVLNI